MPSKSIHLRQSLRLGGCQLAQPASQHGHTHQSFGFFHFSHIERCQPCHSAITTSPFQFLRRFTELGEQFVHSGRAEFFAILERGADCLEYLVHRIQNYLNGNPFFP